MIIYESNYVLVHQGRTEEPAHQEVELTTAPSVNDGTHWGQQVCVSKSSALAFFSCYLLEREREAGFPMGNFSKFDKMIPQLGKLRLVDSRTVALL